MISNASFSRLNRSVNVPNSKPSCVVLELEPAGPDAEDGAARADHVQGRDRLRQQCWIAVRVAGHQRAKLHVFAGSRPERTEGGVGLQQRLVGRADHRKLIEVVHHEDGVEAALVGFLRLADDGREEFVDAGVPYEKLGIWSPVGCSQFDPIGDGPNSPSGRWPRRTVTDVQDLPGDVTRGRAGQEQRQPPDLGGDRGRVPVITRRSTARLRAPATC